MALQMEFAKILKPVVGKSWHHVLNTRDFVQHIKGIKLQQDECIMSYDVKALFTSVPVVPAINTIRDKLTKDKDLQKEYQWQPTSSAACWSSVWRTYTLYSRADIVSS